MVPLHIHSWSFFRDLGCAFILLMIYASIVAAQTSRDGDGKQAVGPMNHIIFFNGTEKKVQYRVWYKGAERQVYPNELGPGEYHLWRETKGLVCRYGSPAEDAALIEGGIYDFRPSKKEGCTLTLVRIALQPDEKRSGDPKADAENQALSKEVTQLTTRVTELQKELDAAKTREKQEEKLRREVGELTARVSALQQELKAVRVGESGLAASTNKAGRKTVTISSDQQTFQLGTIGLVKGNGESSLVLPLKHDGDSPIQVHLTADFELPFGQVRVEPEATEVSSEGQVTPSSLSKDTMEGKGGHLLP